MAQKQESCSTPGPGRRVRAPAWPVRSGRKGYRVTLYLRDPAGPIQARYTHPVSKQLVRQSLGHNHREKAIGWAEELARKLRKGELPDDHAKPCSQRLTLANLLGAYLATVTPHKSPDSQQMDRRACTLWTRFLGAGKDPHRIMAEELEGFRDQRVSGAIDGYGRVVPKVQQKPSDPRRRPVRLRTAQDDAEFLNGVCRWALKRRDPETGQPLMRWNPLRTDDCDQFWTSVDDPNVRRPMAGTDRYRAIRAISDEITMEIRWHGKREIHRSYLTEVLDLAWHTGRRISAILGLRWESVLLGKEYGRYGAIEWPAATDKEKKRWLQPMSPEVRATVDRIRAERPGIGSALLFPRATDPQRPVAKEVAGEWLKEAERLAQVPKHQGGLWHPYRRGWATARKHLPLTDVAAAGGWACTETLSRHYMKPDPDTLLDVMTGAREIREMRA